MVFFNFVLHLQPFHYWACWIFYRSLHGPIFTRMFSEMEFLNGIFSLVFWPWSRVYSESCFCMVFYPHFSDLQNAIHEYRLYSCLVSQVEGTVNSMDQKTRVFCQTDVLEFHLWRWIFLKTYEVKTNPYFLRTYVLKLVCCLVIENNQIRRFCLILWNYIKIQTFWWDKSSSGP